jgi:hypothetical protein
MESDIAVFSYLEARALSNLEQRGGAAKALRNNGSFYRGELFVTTAAFVDE